MTKLSDTQAIILSAAAQRADGNLLPLPGSLRGGAATKVVGALLARGLTREHVIDSHAQGGRGAQHRSGATRTTAAASCSSSPPPGSTPSASSPTAVPYAFNEGINSAGEPAAGAPTGTDEAPVESAGRSAGAGRGRRRPRARTRPLRARPATAPSRRS